MCTKEGCPAGHHLRLRVLSPRMEELLDAVQVVSIGKVT